jgi:hypothetical protein
VEEGALLPIVAGALVPELEAHPAAALRLGRRPRWGQPALPGALGLVLGQRRAQLRVPVREPAPVAAVCAPPVGLEIVAKPGLVEHLLRRLLLRA